MPRAPCTSLATAEHSLRAVCKSSLCICRFYFMASKLIAIYELESDENRFFR